MADIGLKEITVQRREVEVEGQIYAADEDSPANTRKGRKRRRSRISGGVLRVDGNGEPSEYPADGKEKDWELPQEDFRAQFYEHYRKEVKEYDRELMKKNDEEYLNTAQIFGGLFSAVTSAFITQVQPQLQSDPNQETADLLRVLLYKMDNTTFGGDIPTIPRWTTPPRTIISVQAMLYASLATSLLSAFLAMLGKQWLSRYSSIDIRGTAIERSLDRQRKLDGMATWYFDLVMESLPLLLQVALLLLGCALSLYLLEIDMTVAWAVIGVTMLGVIFYAFIVVAGAIFASCPYQTPGARILRHILYNILPSIPGLLHSTLRHVIDRSECISGISGIVWGKWRHWIMSILIFPLLLAYDTYQLTQAMVRVLITPVRKVRSWLRRARTTRTHGSYLRTATLDSQCISWILRTSLERGVRLSTLKYLATMPTLASFTPTLVLDCFGILIDCIKVNEGKPAIVQGMEQLGEASAMCFFLAYSHLSAVDSMSSVLADVQRRYRRIFPLDLDFTGPPFRHTLDAIHGSIYWDREAEVPIEWKDYRPATNEHITVSRAFSKLSWSGYQSLGRVPIPCLSFARHYLSQDPLPPPSVIADCLLIVAIDLGCNVPKTMILGESAQPEVSGLIIQKLDTAGSREFGQEPRTIAILLSYAIQLERCGETNIFDKILRYVKMRSRENQSFPPALLSETFNASVHASPRAVMLLAPYLDWRRNPFVGAQGPISKWAPAISVAPHTEEVAQSVVDALLQIAANSNLRPSIPPDVWLWLNERPPLPPVCKGRWLGDNYDIVRTVRGLNDIEILTSYLILIWSEWGPLDRNGFVEMCASIREEFDGVGNGHHREELIQRVDYILGELDRRSGRPDVNLEDDGLWRHQIRHYSQIMKEQYGQLKGILQEVDQEATETLNQSHSTFMCALPLPCP